MTTWREFTFEHRAEVAVSEAVAPKKLLMRQGCWSCEIGWYHGTAVLMSGGFFYAKSPKNRKFLKENEICKTLS